MILNGLSMLGVDLSILEFAPACLELAPACLEWASKCLKWAFGVGPRMTEVVLEMSKVSIRMPRDFRIPGQGFRI